MTRGKTFSGIIYPWNSASEFESSDLHWVVTVVLPIADNQTFIPPNRTSKLQHRAVLRLWRWCCAEGLIYLRLKERTEKWSPLTVLLFTSYALLLLLWTKGSFIRLLTVTAAPLNTIDTLHMSSLLPPLFFFCFMTLFCLLLFVLNHLSANSLDLNVLALTVWNREDWHRQPYTTFHRSS